MSTNQKTIYLDYAASTPLDEDVLQAMLPYFNERFGNPSSMHHYGQEADAAVENARSGMAELLNCNPKEVIFTSCGSESDNLALRGVAHAARATAKKNHILTTPVEHHAVFHTAEQLATLEGFEVEFLPVDEYGRVAPAEVVRRIRPDTALVSVIYANNEIGTLNPIAEIGAVCREKGVPLHTDAVQACAHLPIDVETLNVDLLSVGAHKFYGPKGIGALYVRQGTAITPTQTGGAQEFGLRAGTHNTPLIVGMTEALKLVREKESVTQQLSVYRDKVIERVLAEIPDARLSGHPQERLPNHASFVFKHVDSNTLLMLLDSQGFACSSSSACKTGDPEPSQVLRAIGISNEWAKGSLRVTLGRPVTAEQIDRFLEVLPDAVARARALEAS